MSTYIMALARLGADVPGEAQAELTAVVSQWSHEGFHVQHHTALVAQVLIHLYNGDGPAAWAEVVKQTPAYRKAGLKHMQHAHNFMLQTQARSALATAASGSQRRPELLRSAARDARHLERQPTAWPRAWAMFIRAAIASLEGDKARSRTLLADAAEGFERIDMRLCAASCRRRLGQLCGGEEGRSLIARADSWMLGQNIKNPARMAAMYTAGFRDC
jgi:hypothetical protein